jgi:uncharacterized protein YjaG (DUF416 family)
MPNAISHRYGLVAALGEDILPKLAIFCDGYEFLVLAASGQIVRVSLKSQNRAARVNFKQRFELFDSNPGCNGVGVE